VSVTEAFWDSYPSLRRFLLVEAGGRTAGRSELDLDAFHLELDYDAGTATVAGVQAPREPETTDLAEFLSRVASFGDDPTIGDGLTHAQRHPPRFRADAAGQVERLDDDPS
jgi:hypothetical protein